MKRENALRERTINSVRRIADLVDVRDPYTASHSRRVAAIAREIATEMGLDPSEIIVIERAGYVHDIGKIVIDLGLLAKPSKLTDEEWKIFQQHPATGVQMLELYPDFADGIALVRSHHERVDGRGYPDGLVGEAIPIGARILAVADGFDAMASPRPYRDALPAEVVLGELQKGRGTQWDANAIDALLRLISTGRVNIGDANQRPYIVDSIGYQEDLEFEAA
ncbi:MAG: HD-GYP domain-containing protein [Thermomicrobiales bacterium]